jgi:hypothetical protein
MEAGRLPTSGHNDEALPAVLMRVVSELHDVAYLIERIEPQLNAQLDGELTPDRVKLLQGLDLAVQKARGLAEFIDTITGTLPAHVQVDISTALSLVKLSEMKKALGSGVRYGHSQPLGKASGDVDLF